MVKPNEIDEEPIAVEEEKTMNEVYDNMEELEDEDDEPEIKYKPIEGVKFV